jgi:hypothetical protein
VAFDAYALSVEGCLRELESQGGDSLRVESGGEGVCVAFGRTMATAENYDIALLRLGMALLDVHEHREAITEVLRKSRLADKG